eukprot:4495797-Amphidinium_carterae.2
MHDDKLAHALIAETDRPLPQRTLGNWELLLLVAGKLLRNLQTQLINTLSVMAFSNHVAKALVETGRIVTPARISHNLTDQRLLPYSLASTPSEFARVSTKGMQVKQVQAENTQRPRIKIGLAVRSTPWYQTDAMPSASTIART